jgi:predicted nuclease of predicted toxin-antitoxin system
VSLAIYMDVQVPAAITRGLRRRGITVLTAQEDGATRFPDPALLDRATLLGHILFTRDQDLLAEAAARLRRGERFATVVFARQLEVSIGRCISDLEIIAQGSKPEEACNQIVYLPL